MLKNVVALSPFFSLSFICSFLAVLVLVYGGPCSPISTATNGGYLKHVQGAGAAVWEWDSMSQALITADSFVWLAGPRRCFIEGLAQALMLRSI